MDFVTVSTSAAKLLSRDDFDVHEVGSSSLDSVISRLEATPRWTPE